MLPNLLQAPRPGLPREADKLLSRFCTRRLHPELGLAMQPHTVAGSART